LSGENKYQHRPRPSTLYDGTAIGSSCKPLVDEGTLPDLRNFPRYILKGLRFKVLANYLSLNLVKLGHFGAYLDMIVAIKRRAQPGPFNSLNS
jgi:hypothetical protein